MWNGNFVVTKTSFLNFSIPDFNSPFRKNKCGFYSRAAFNYFVNGICAASIQGWLLFKGGFYSRKYGICTRKGISNPSDPYNSSNAKGLIFNISRSWRFLMKFSLCSVASRTKIKTFEPYGPPKNVSKKITKQKEK